MLTWLRAVARFLTNTIGWNRIGFLLSVAIIAVAMVVLVHMLRDLDIDQVFAAHEGGDAASHRRWPDCSSPAAISR